jgi:hypothetical protein
MQCIVYCDGKSVCLSVNPSVTFVSCAKSVTAAAVINSSLDSLFHLVLGKLRLVDGGSPNFPQIMLNGAVVATL